MSAVRSGRVTAVPALAVALVALVLTTAALAITPGAARAVGWTLVGCTQPNGQPAPTEGWTTGFWSGGPVAGSGDISTCATGGSLSAVSGTTGQPTSFSGPEWIFTAPPNATIAGGSLTATLQSPQGQTWLGTPGPAFDSGDLIASCEVGIVCGSAVGGSASGVFEISHPGGTQIFAPALCVDDGQPTCPAGGPSPVNAEVDIHAADIELTDLATPTASNVGGTLLTHNVSGTADLRFLATDPSPNGGSGPGVYGVTVEIDGAPVYSAVPGNNKGECVPLGTDPVTGGLEFDHSQPCAESERVVIPVDTTSLTDGRHVLTVEVSDAAGNVSTALNRVITTHNQPPPKPKPKPIVASRPIIVKPPHVRYGAHAELRVGYRVTGSHTRLRLSATTLVKGGRITARCVGGGCPSFSPRAVTARKATTLWRALSAARFTAGQRLLVTFSVPHRHRERVQITFRRERAPATRAV